MQEAMRRLDAIPDAKGLCHADLSPSNTIAAERGPVPIDFSLSGYGYLCMDVGMLISQYEKPELQRGILTGYGRSCGIRYETRDIEAFYALSVLLFIACQHDRFYAQDWYPAAIRRWCETLFLPLARGERFLSI